MNLAMWIVIIQGKIVYEIVGGQNSDGILSPLMAIWILLNTLLEYVSAKRINRILGKHDLKLFLTLRLVMLLCNFSTLKNCQKFKI